MNLEASMWCDSLEEAGFDTRAVRLSLLGTVFPEDRSANDHDDGYGYGTGNGDPGWISGGGNGGGITIHDFPPTGCGIPDPTDADPWNLPNGSGRGDSRDVRSFDYVWWWWPDREEEE